MRLRVLLPLLLLLLLPLMLLLLLPLSPLLLLLDVLANGSVCGRVDEVLFEPAVQQLLRLEGARLAQPATHK